MIKDINSYVPMNNNTTYCLDTNALYWYCYPRYGINLKPNRVSEIGVYYDFVDRLVQNGNTIVTSIYNVSEFLNIIEKHECEIYQKLNRGIKYNIKDLRNIEAQRANLKRQMTVSINNVYAICKVLEYAMERTTIDNFVDKLHEHKCDVFDYVILDYYKKNKNLNIVTDDADFMSIDGINIFTANPQILHK